MLMRASTNVLVAGPLPPGPAPTLLVAGSVSRVIVTPPKLHVTDALAVTLPADADVNVTVHWPLVVPADAHVSLTRVIAAPLDATSVTTGLVPLGTATKPLPLPMSR